YRLHAELARPGPAALDYYLDYRFAPELAIRAGQDKIFFTRAWWASDSSIDLFERPAAVDQLRYDRDIGVWAHGRLLDDRIGYWAGVSNGAGPNQVNDNIDFVSLLRADAVVLGSRFEPLVDNFERDGELRLMVGGGVVHDLVRLPGQVAGIEVGNRDVDRDGTGDNVRVWSSSLDLALRLHGFEVVLEGIWRHERWGTILDHSDNQQLADAVQPDVEGHRNYLAGYVHASYALLPGRLQVAARIGQDRVPLLRVGGRAPASVPPGDRLVEAAAQVRYEWSETLALG